MRHVNDGQLAEIIRLKNIDWIFIIGWSQIAGPEVLASPRCGVLGMHPTLLPKGRGRASIPWAILKGLNQTGVTLFKLDHGVDTGPIISQRVVQIASDETSSSLYSRITDAHVSLIRESWPLLVSNSVILHPQDVTCHCLAGRSPDDGVILPSMTVLEID